MSTANFRGQLVRIAYEDVSVRGLILPLITTKVASSEVDLEKRIIRLAYLRPDLRSKLLPVLQHGSIAKVALKKKEGLDEAQVRKVAEAAVKSAKLDPTSPEGKKILNAYISAVYHNSPLPIETAKDKTMSPSYFMDVVSKAVQASEQADTNAVRWLQSETPKMAAWVADQMTKIETGEGGAVLSVKDIAAWLGEAAWNKFKGAMEELGAELKDYARDKKDDAMIGARMMAEDAKDKAKAAPKALLKGVGAVGGALLKGLAVVTANVGSAMNEVGKDLGYKKITDDLNKTFGSLYAEMEKNQKASMAAVDSSTKRQKGKAKSDATSKSNAQKATEYDKGREQVSLNDAEAGVKALKETQKKVESALSRIDSELSSKNRDIDAKAAEGKKKIKKSFLTRKIGVKIAEAGAGIVAAPAVMLGAAMRGVGASMDWVATKSYEKSTGKSMPRMPGTTKSRNKKKASDGIGEMNLGDYVQSQMEELSKLKEKDLPDQLAQYYDEDGNLDEEKMKADFAKAQEDTLKTISDIIDEEVEKILAETDEDDLEGAELKTKEQFISKTALIRTAYENPQYRRRLLPLLQEGRNHFPVSKVRFALQD